MKVLCSRDSNNIHRMSTVVYNNRDRVPFVVMTADRQSTQRVPPPAGSKVAAVMTGLPLTDHRGNDSTRCFLQKIMSVSSDCWRRRRSNHCVYSSGYPLDNRVHRLHHLITHTDSLNESPLYNALTRCSTNEFHRHCIIWNDTEDANDSTECEQHLLKWFFYYFEIFADITMIASVGITTSCVQFKWSFIFQLN